MPVAIERGCTPDRSKRDVAGPYKTWNEVIERWIGGKTPDLYVELGPPNLYLHELEDGMTEMVWDCAIDRMPGQADYYDLRLFHRTEGPSTVRFICLPMRKVS